MPYQAEPILNRLRLLGVVAPHAIWTSLAGGTINSVWRISTAREEPVIVRVGPSREETDAGPSWMRVDALACEAIALDRVRDSVPCVPVPVAAGFRDPDRAWLAQTVVPGQSVGLVLPRMTARERSRLWGELGAITSRLHAVRGPWFGTPDGRQRYPDWPSMVHSDAVGMLEDARRHALDLRPFEQVLETIERHRDALGEVRAPSVVHSDLDPRHIFVQPGRDGWKITGVIDWEYARYADPRSESLLVLMVARPEDDPDREAFLAGYGLEAGLLADPGFQARQTIYRGVAEGWALTDAGRLKQRHAIVQ